VALGLVGPGAFRVSDGAASPTRGRGGPVLCALRIWSRCAGMALLLTGRLVKVVEPETYTRKDGTERTSYPALVVLSGDETVKVEYRDITVRDDVLLAAFGDKSLQLAEDGSALMLPEVTIPVRALGAWDAESRSFGAVRLAGI